MSCPTCDHTLSRWCIHDGMSFDGCDRCGTMVVTVIGQLKIDPINPRVYVPKLVERCREFGSTMFKDGDLAAMQDAWHRLGISESIYKPEDRPTN